MKKIILSLFITFIIFSCKSDKKNIRHKINEKSNIQNGISKNANDLKINDSIYLIPVHTIDVPFLEKYRVIMFSEKKIKQDSLDFYKDVLFSQSNIGNELKKDYIYKSNLALLPVLKNKLTWINENNIPKKIRTINLKLIPNKNNISYLTVFVVYENLDSYFSFYMDSNFDINGLPVTKLTSLIIIGIKEENYFFDEINIDEKTNEIFNLDLKEIDYEKISELF